MEEARPRTISTAAPGRREDASEWWRRFSLADALVLVACLALGLAAAGPFRSLWYLPEAGRPVAYFLSASAHGGLFAMPAVLAFQWGFRGRRARLGAGEIVGVSTSAWWLLMFLMGIVSGLTRDTGALALVCHMIIIEVVACPVLLILMATWLASPRTRSSLRWSDYLGFFVGLAPMAQASIIAEGLGHL